MNFLKPLADPWAFWVTLVMVAGLAALWYFQIGFDFSAGFACGAVTGLLIYHALRVDDRPIWRRLFGIG